MQIDTPVRISNTTVVGADPSALGIVEEANRKMHTVNQSYSVAVNQPELVTLLDQAIAAGKQHLQGILRDAQQIGGNLQRAMKDPESLTVARNNELASRNTPGGHSRA